MYNGTAFGHKACVAIEASHHGNTPHVIVSPNKHALDRQTCMGMYVYLVDVEGGVRLVVRDGLHERAAPEERLGVLLCGFCIACEGGGRMWECVKGEQESVVLLLCVVWYGEVR